ncbi:MAG: hypothetical protein K2X93_00725 [Candidatus Obscuribacterales bacterium]|nr:hypothetical protein [Candidatus Obscuribacterales bacterium]
MVEKIGNTAGPEAPGTLEQPDESYFNALNTLTKEDFKLIDTNNSGAVSASELDIAAKYSNFDKEKTDAIESIHEHVTNSGRQVDLMGEERKMTKAIISWHSPEFAKQNLSKDDFALIDRDDNNQLDQTELKNAKNLDLNPVAKQAAQVMSDYLDARLNDPLLDIKGTVKNWHRGDERAEKTSPAQKPDGQSTPGLKLEIEEGVSYRELDAQNRPTLLESGSGTVGLKYDDKGRVIEITDKGGFAHGSSESLSKISYDDKASTQTVRRFGLDGKEYSTTVNKVDASGRILEEHHDDGFAVSKTKFDKEGRIVQLDETFEKGRVETSVKYDATGERSSTTVRYDESGAKEHSTVCRGDKVTTTYFDGEKPNRVTEVTGKGKNALVKESLLNADGSKHSSTEVKFSNKPYLVGEMKAIDAFGNVESEAKAEWKMVSPSIGQVTKIHYTADGETKILDPKTSIGDDLKQFLKLQNKFHRNSTMPESERFLEASPGKMDLKVFFTQAV